jgi:methylated-DNA-[protein]-cysteine S-methyltransferase
MTFLSFYSSPVGEITLASDGEHLTGLWFDGQKHYGSTINDEPIEKTLPVFGRTAEWLDIYFGGGVPSFTPPVKLAGTVFQLSVWEILKAIPYGQTVTYGEIAKALANQKGIRCVSAQAVGGAVGLNPVSIIVPCHRVLRKGGCLTGYAGGTDKKAYLLNLEKSEFKAV